MAKKKLPFVFHIANVKTEDSENNLKLLYLEYLAYWKKYKLLSNKNIIIPTALQYQFHISGEIADHVFELLHQAVYHVRHCAAVSRYVVSRIYRC